MFDHDHRQHDIRCNPSRNVFLRFQRWFLYLEGVEEFPDGLPGE
jgi:hypothetical protein